MGYGISNIWPEWVRRLYDRWSQASIVSHVERADMLARRGAEERVLDIALGAVDDALIDAQYDNVDAVLRALDFDALDFDVCVTVLMGTKLARDRLPSRAIAIERFAARLRRDHPARADQILQHL